MSPTLTAVPDAQRLYLRAASTVLRRPKARPQLPALDVRVNAVRVDPRHLSAYRELCGFTDLETLPITFPHVMAGALHLHLMTRPAFPLPLLGLVHLRNEIRQGRPLQPDEILDLHVRVGESREVRQGLEFDLLSEVLAGDEAVWTETMTVLHRAPAPKDRSKREPPAADSRLTQYKSFSAPADIGRCYAAIGRDYNPIHLTPWSAKLFGFKRHIAHGMWSLARCAALLEDEIGRAPSALDVQFRQPLFLPGRAALKYRNDGNTIDFALLSATSDKTHLTGTLR